MREVWCPFAESLNYPASALQGDKDMQQLSENEQSYPLLFLGTTNLSWLKAQQGKSEIMQENTIKQKIHDPHHLVNFLRVTLN